jgi:pimeloyl-ACP methyl ester carboxylesterase
MRIFGTGWWSSLSVRRRLLVVLVVIIIGAGGAAAGIGAWLGGPADALPSSSGPGAILLVPGYGGSTSALDVLAARIRQTGRSATVVQLAGDGTGDLNQQAVLLDGYVNRALRAGSGPVTVIGYSAGGVVAWLWAVRYDGAARAARIITLGSPLHGAQLAATGSALAPGACPTACQQLAPGSRLLAGLDVPVPTPPYWLSIWTTGDQTVTPPDSARLDGAVNVPVQSVCPALRLGHGDLPTDPTVARFVLVALGAGPLAPPTPTDC